jgi:hypothetical protein
MRKLTCASLTILMGLSLGIVVAANCGSSWDSGPTTFSPTLNVAGCLHGYRANHYIR